MFKNKKHNTSLLFILSVGLTLLFANASYAETDAFYADGKQFITIDNCRLISDMDFLPVSDRRSNDKFIPFFTCRDDSVRAIDLYRLPFPEVTTAEKNVMEENPQWKKNNIYSVNFTVDAETMNEVQRVFIALDFHKVHVIEHKYVGQAPE